ncbi:MAG: diaminopimelate epimerase [Candidatus Wenzhouxiangella sp. M2_3B_020]
MGRLPAGLEFAKLEALGNDFVLVDARRELLEFDTSTVRAIASRRRGIGCDQVLVLRDGGEARRLEVDIFNADGSGAEQCGNGMRAIAAWLAGRSELAGTVELSTPAGTVHVRHDGDGRFEADLPGPVPGTPRELGLPPLPDELSGGMLLTMGNPHLVVFGDHAPTSDALGEIVERLEREAEWRNRVNVGLAYRAGSGRIELRVHERGAGPTLACGSGACAAARAAAERDRASGAKIVVEQPGGRLVVDFATPERVVTRGPAHVVFEGRVA